MNFKPINNKKTYAFSIILILFCSSLFSQEVFIYRPYLAKVPFSLGKKISLHGEFFAHLQYPGTFPSYNDLSGREDRWTFGFQNIIFLTHNTSFLAQLVTHDDGQRRTKFDWHFSVKHLLFENFVLIVGHDSNHDSDHQSLVDGKTFYVNRNYVGFGLPYETESIYLEPFTWVFHNTNQRGHLDLSGEKLKQEYGIRLGVWMHKNAILSLQMLSQSESFFSSGQALMLDLILRARLTDYVHLSLSLGLWKDLEDSPLGRRKRFYKIMWGIVVPF